MVMIKAISTCELYPSIIRFYYVLFVCCIPATNQPRFIVH